MQIVRTEVAHATAPSGQPVIRVQFYGEGGEFVTVNMMASDRGNDAAAIDRAKEILIQIATLDSAVNEYDARSNGNFDEVAVACASNANGAIYILEYRDGEATRQVPPCRMPSFEAARSEAMRGAIDLLADPQSGQGALTGWLVRVWSEDGDLLCTIDVQEAEAQLQAAPSLTS
jgi:hypothetical protein